MNVAQLKRHGEPDRRARRQRFHVRMNVAQLKLDAAALVRDVIQEFPRSNERGSIEANRWNVARVLIAKVSTFE